MADGKQPVEPRPHQRSQISRHALVAFRPDDDQRRRMVDMSVDGLAFRFLAGKEPSNGSHLNRNSERIARSDSTELVEVLLRGASIGHIPVQ